MREQIATHGTDKYGFRFIEVCCKKYRDCWIDEIDWCFCAAGLLLLPSLRIRLLGSVEEGDPDNIICVCNIFYFARSDF